MAEPDISRHSAGPSEGGRAHPPVPLRALPFRLDPDSDPARSMSLLGAVARAAEVLTGTPDLASALTRATRVLGEAAGVDRVNVFCFDHAARAGFLFAEWSAEGVQPTSALTTGPFAYHAFEEVWRPTMAGEVYHSPTHAMTGANAELNVQAAVITDVHVPVMVDGRFWGTLNFDDCTTERSWSYGEIEVLRAAAATVAAAVRRHELERERERAARERAEEAERLGGLLQGVVAASRALLDEPELTEGLRRWCGHLASAMGADRAGVGRFVDEPGHPLPRPVNYVDWVPPGAEPLDGVSVPRTADFDAWSRRLLRGEVIWATHGELSDPASREYWDATNCQANYIVPVMVDGSAWGWLYLDFETLPAHRNGDVHVLRTAADGAAAAVRRHGALRAVLEERAARVRAERARSEEMGWRNALLMTATEAAQALIGAPTLDAAADGVLATLGRQLRVDRAALGVLTPAGDGGYWCELAHEWSSPGTPRQIDDPALRRTRLAGDAEDIARLLRGDPIQGVTEELPEPARSEQRATGAVSQFAFPIMLDGELWGVLGFDDCTRVRRWDEGEIAFLGVVGAALSAAVRRERVEREHRESVARERERSAEERLEVLRQHNEVLEQRAALLRAITEVSQRLLDAATPDAAFDDIVELLGVASGVDRVSLMRFSPPDACSRRGWAAMAAEWDAPGILRQMDTREHTINLDDLGPLYDRWLAGDVVMPTDALPEPFRSGQTSLGVRTQVAVFIPGLAGEHWGLLGFDDCTRNREWDEGFLSVLRVGAALLGSSLQRRILDERRRQAERAVHVEREQAARERADELVRVNLALREREVLLAAAAHASRALMESGDLAAAIPEALELLGRTAGWSRTQILLDGRNSAGQPGHVVHAEWVADGVAPQLGHTTHEFIADADVLPLATQVRGGEAFWLTISEMPAEARLVFAPLEIRTTAAVPVFVDGAYVGAVGFDDCVRERPRTEHELDALRTTSRIFAAALHRDRLVDAVAREREMAARQRATELAHANQVLQRTVGRLADLRDTSAFYLVALGEMALALSADWVGLMMYDAARGTFRMTCSLLGGVQQPLRGTDPDKLWSLDDPIVAAAWAAIQRADPVLEGELDGPYVHPRVRSWHHARGHSACLFLPLYRGVKPLGFAAFGVRAGSRATRLQGELARALGQQLALAMELDRLGEQGRHAAVLEERTRLAREIHDTLAHGLAGIAVTLEGARGILPRDAEQGLAHVDTALALARESLAEARYALHALRPLAHPPVGLGLALQQLVARFNGHNGTAVRVEAPEGPLPLAEEAEVELLRIAQEGVSNAVRHARARVASVTLSYQPDGALALCVSDDGRGFDLAALEPAQRVGITGMRERAARLGGALEVASRPGGGTVLKVLVPVRHERRTAERQR